MSQIVFSLHESQKKVDGSVRRQAYAFLEKLAENDALPGLHVEPIGNSADARVRTGRVSDFWRAVLFKVQGQGAEAHYVYLGVWPHDDAIALAQRARLSVNPVNGIAELILADEPAAPSPAAEVHAPAPVTVASPTTTPAATPEEGRHDSAAPILAALGVTLSDLVDELGIDAELAERALSTTSEDALLNLAAAAVQWQGSALVDLASGESVAAVKETLRIGDEELETPETEDEDAELIAALKHPAARMQFAFIEDDEELRRAIEDEDFAAWRVFLHPEQRRYATQRYGGSFRLSGGAGTGKTVVLLHRARMLHEADATARIVLTTFTRTLADAMRRDLQALDPSIAFAKSLGDPGVYVAGVDSVVSSVLKTGQGQHLRNAVESVLGPRSDRIQARTTKAGEQWRESFESVSSEVPADLRNVTFFEAEYAMVVLPLRLTSREAYFRARRPGRGVALDRSRRNAVWDVVQAYRATSSVNGSLDFGEAAAVAADLLDDTGERPVDHALVDEGQDFNPTHWQFVRALVAEGADDIFIAEDAQQRIYGQRVVLGRHGIKIVGRSRRLQLNYRTTAQNLHFAMGVLQDGEYLDLEAEQADMTGYRSARSGPPPRLIPTDSLTDELEQAASVVAGWLEDDDVDPATIGILVRDAVQASQVARGLDERGVTARVITNQSATSNRPQIMTMHRAKGMEFSRVLIFGAQEGLVPASYLLNSVGDAEREEILQRERSLFYVAATRARDELVILWTGDKSQFLKGESE